MFFRLLLESFRRQRRRKTLAGIAILLGTTAVTAMLALATTVGDRIHQELAVYGANIVVYPQADTLNVKVGGLDLKPATGGAYLYESDLAKLRGIFWANNITGVSPELTLTVPIVPDSVSTFREPIPTEPVTAIGVWFNHQFGEGPNAIITGAAQLHPLWKLRGSWPTQAGEYTYQPLDVVLGATLARTLKTDVGHDIYTSLESLSDPDGRGSFNRKLHITGIVESGDKADSELFLPLVSAQALIQTPDAVSRVEISARTKPEDAFARSDPDKLSPAKRDIWYCRPYANSIAYQIREAIPGAQAEQVRQVEQSEGTVLSRISGLMWLISASALIAAGFAVSAAMATAVLERRAEIGLMRSLGASRGTIALLFYSETGILAVFAGACGYLIGSGLAAWLGARIFAPEGSATHAAISIANALNPVLLPVVVGLALLVAIAGSTPAIRTALAMDPSAILRADA